MERKRNPGNGANPGALMSKPRRVLTVLAAVGLLLGLTGGTGAWWYRTTRPDYRLRRGQEAARQGDFDLAEDLADRLEASGYAPKAHLLRATLALERNRPNDAVAAFNQIEDTETRLEAAGLYGEWLVRRQLQPAEAERLFTFVLSERPDDLLAHRSLAAIYYDQGAWVASIMHLLKWTQLDDSDGRPYRFMGLIYKDMDQLTPAIPAYREALRRELKPDVTRQVREELAECLVRQSLFDEALDVLREVGPRADVVPELVAVRGEALWGVGQVAEGEALVENALRKHPEMPELLRVRAKLFMAAQKADEAERLLRRLVERDPNDTASRHQLALACERLERREEAAAHRRIVDKVQKGMLAVTKMIEEVGEKPWDTALHKRLAEACRQMGREDLARRWDRSAAAAPGTPGGRP